MKAKIEKFQDGLDRFMKNEYWRKLYENAPDGAKLWLEAEFHASVNPESRPQGAMQDPDFAIYTEPLKEEDWIWLSVHNSHHPKQKEWFLKKAAEAKAKV